ncbi:helix-turn-helix domain-containing protein [Corynebacterium comes]|nr:helix-turn-helix domain-containing protein [Corynebacterium comes]
MRSASATRRRSQSELAAHAGLTRPTIARVERGDDVSTSTRTEV